MKITRKVEGNDYFQSRNRKKKRKEGEKKRKAINTRARSKG